SAAGVCPGGPRKPLPPPARPARSRRPGSGTCPGGRTSEETRSALAKARRQLRAFIRAVRHSSRLGGALERQLFDNARTAMAMARLPPSRPAVGLRRWGALAGHHLRHTGGQERARVVDGGHARVGFGVGVDGATGLPALEVDADLASNTAHAQAR